MDREPEELQFLGSFGIYKEACKIIFSWRKIFTQITIALIIPLTFIFLAHIEISGILLSKIHHNEITLDQTQIDSPKYNKITDHISSEWATIWLFKITYFIFFLVLSLLSTSAIVYTIACIYTAKEVTFRKVMSVVPKVWKRLMVTFLVSFLIIFVYNIVAVLTLILVVLLIGNTKFGEIILVLLIIIYLIGLLYVSIVWHLASIVSVLEDVYGVQAMIKSKNLIKGKMGVAIFIFLKLNIAFTIIQVTFERLVVHGESLGMGNRVGYGILFFLLLLILILFGLVVQTVIYFVCKSYHHENIDKSSLADHLEVYQGEYVPLKEKDLQLEQLFEFPAFANIRIRIAPNVLTFTIMVNACCKDDWIWLKKWRTWVLKQMINGNVDLGEMEAGNGVLRLMSKRGISRNVVTCTLLIKGYCKQGKMHETEEALRVMKEELSLVTDELDYGVLLDGYCRISKMNEGS
ncbi:hypothetical protein HHK36_030469 [Tetracentron sinense]|uniref:Uncharacterized protein n=1 Tax=Tetracentron sinense TaxID=13715 RepID=A0A835D0N8_TETSI|nr:hypothetical protein HHK36_030469 [Tetracentron sinense]